MYYAKLTLLQSFIFCVARCSGNRCTRIEPVVVGTKLFRGITENPLKHVGYACPDIGHLLLFVKAPDIPPGIDGPFRR